MTKPAAERMMMKAMTVLEIVKLYLEANGYDGLYDDDCGCGKDDLAPCAGIDCFSHCRPGVAVILDDGEPGIGPREEKK